LAVWTPSGAHAAGGSKCQGKGARGELGGVWGNGFGVTCRADTKREREEELQTAANSDAVE